MSSTAAPTPHASTAVGTWWPKEQVGQDHAVSQLRGRCLLTARAVLVEQQEETHSLPAPYRLHRRTSASLQQLGDIGLCC